MRSPRRVLYERIAKLGDESERYVDVGAQLRVYERGPNDKPVPGELLPRIYGGRYDTWQKRYVGPPQKVVEIACHPGQVALLTFDDAELFRVLALGAKGGGKTEAIVRRAVINALIYPAKYHGVVGPTASATGRPWKKAIALLGGLGWIKEIKAGDGEILMINGATLDFVGAKRQSDKLGSRIAGADWHTAVEDEQQYIDQMSLEEVEARGRENPDYQIFSTATNEALVDFQERVSEYRDAPDVRVIDFDCYSNSFVSKRYWKRLQGRYSPSTWKRIMRGLDVPLDGRVYPEFSIEDSISPCPKLGGDVTRQITNKKYGHPYRLIVGTDFGTLKTASIVLRAFTDPNPNSLPGELLWWAVDELVTIGKTSAHHLDALLKRYPLRSEIDEFGRKTEKHSQFVMISMPHVNANQAGKEERTDYHIARKKGIRIVRASGTRISRHHRFNMVNALLQAEDGRRRLAIDCDSHKKAECTELVKSLYGYMQKDIGLKKNKRDLSDASDALGYAVFPWERIRGSGEIRELGSGAA